MKLKNLLLLLMTSFLLLSCNLASVFMEEEEELTLEHFVFEASVNEVLTGDLTAQIQGNEIHIALPWDIINQNIALTPTVTLSKSGSYNPYNEHVWKNNDIFEVLTNSGLIEKTYTMKISVISGTLSAISVSKPFYIENEEKVYFDDNIVIETDDFGRSVTVLLPGDQFSFLEKIKPMKIGFDELDVPFFGDNDLSKLIFGDVMPYTVDYTCEDRTSTNTFSFNIDKGESDRPFMSSFDILVADNPGLPYDINAYIFGQNIFLELPFSVIKQSTPLLARMEFNLEGYGIPNGSQVWETGDQIATFYKDGFPFIFYDINVDVKSDSVSTLTVDDPFYVSSGSKIPFSGVEIVYSNYGQDINLVFPSSDHARYASLVPQSIGFNTVNVANLAGNDYSKLFYGAVMPYTVEQTSEDGSFTSTFTFSMSRIKNSDPSISSITAGYKKLYTRNIYINRTSTDINTWLDVDTFVIGKNPSGGVKMLSAMPMSRAWHYIDFGPNTSKANNIALKNQCNFSQVHSSTDIARGGQETKASGNAIDLVFDYPDLAAATTARANESKVFQMRYTDGQGHVFSKDETYTLTSSFYTTYTALDHVELNYVVIDTPYGCTFSNVVIDSKCSSFTASGSRLTIYLNATTTKQTGNIATFTITAEDGTQNNESITIY